MNPERPSRRRDGNLSAGDCVFVEINAVLLPPEQDPYGGVRHGRPGGPPPEMLRRDNSTSPDPPPAAG